MHLQFSRTHKSLHDFPATGELPAFIVLTGENGAGKSQLLEAIRDGSIIGDWPQRLQAVRMMTTAELAVSGDIPGGGETREQLVDRFESTVRQYLTQGITFPVPELIPSLHPQLVGNSIVSQGTIDRIETASGKPLHLWSRTEFVAFTPDEVGYSDPFNVAVGEAFSRYRQMLTMNGYSRWRAAEFGERSHWLSDEDFEREHGPAPWDLLNAALATVGLKYKFDVPEQSLSPTMTAPRLRDVESSQEVGGSSLSSGEKTLLMIAMSLYSVTHRSATISMPEILLLDEPDATLHPSMIRSLISLLQEQFVSRHGVRVIMTTHSPTTVALAPEESLYIMERSGSPRFQKAASKDAALSRLLIGVPMISVAAEHRRVVVVESPNDERLYSSIQNILGPNLRSERSLAFMPAGGNGLPDGCAAVVGLVGAMRDRGNPAVWGIVDRDDRVSEPHSFVFMDASRYSIENAILDPMSIGLLLLAEAHPDVLAKMAPIDILTFDPARDGQRLVDVVTHAVRQISDDATLQIAEYADGLTLQVQAFWTQMRGHDLEANRVLTAFASLNIHRDRLKDRVIERVWRTRPSLIPRPTVDLFLRLLE